MRKLYLIVSIAVLMSLTACVDAPAIDEVVITTTEFDNQHTVTQAQALQKLAAVLDVIDAPATRGGAKARKARTIEAVTSSDLFGAATRATVEMLPDTLIYLVHFDEGEGSAVLGADDRLEPIIAIYDDFQITPDDLLVSEEPVRELTIDDLYCEDDDDYYLGAFNPEGVADMPDLDLRAIDQYVEAVDYGATVHPKNETGWICKLFLPPMLTTLWRQDSPFNDLTPHNYPAGCVAIAVAQIMAYHEFPRDYCNWEVAKRESNDTTERDETNLELAKLSERIGRGCHMKYNFFWSGQSFATPAKAKRFLKDIGYGGTSRHIGYDTDLIRSSLKAGCPVFIGALTPGCVGHAWVIDGMIYRENAADIYCGERYMNTEVQTQLLLHCNWGWEGRRNGYFANRVFNVIAGPVEDSTFQPETRGGADNFTWWFRIVTYNKPN